MVAAFAVSLTFSGIACSSKSDNAGKCPTQETVDGWNKVFDSEDDPLGEIDYAAMQKNFEKVLTEVGSYLPSDLKKELDDVKKLMADYFGILANVDPSNPESISEEQMKQLESFDSSAIEATMEKVKNHFKENCPDISFGESDDDSASGSDAGSSEAETVTTES